MNGPGVGLDSETGQSVSALRSQHSTQCTEEATVESQRKASG